MVQPHWSAGGAVNAIDKMRPVLDEVRAIREDWLTRPDQQHPLVSPGTIVPTIIRGGTWDVTYPASCELVCEIMYLPTHVDKDGTGRSIEREVQERIERAVSADPWFTEHPLGWFWDTDVVPGEIPADHPLVSLTLEAAAGLGRGGGKPDGFDSWHDAATFTRDGTPTFSFGPGGAETAHAVDEYTPVQDLIDVAATVAVTAMRWCGVVE
jgi:acetylornithine deacetylase